MKSPEGAFDRVAWVAYDITQRKVFEAATQHRDGILKATATANNTLLTHADAEGAVHAALRDVGHAVKADRMVVFDFVDSGDAATTTFSWRLEWSRVGDPAGKSGNDLQPLIECREGLMESSFPGWLDCMRDTSIVVLEGGKNLTTADKSTLSRMHSQALLAVPLWLETRLSGFILAAFSEVAHKWTAGEMNAMRY